MKELCSENFADFFESICESIYSLPKMMQRISENLHLIADDIHLGRFSVNVSLPASIYEPKGMTSNSIPYTSPNGYGSDVFEKSYVTSEGGAIVLRLNSSKDYTWTQEEKISLNHFCQITFMLCSRTRLMGLMYKVERRDSLSGALNSRGLQEAATMLIQDGLIGQYSTVFTNIKSFKFINQQVGGSNGDTIIKQYCAKSTEFIGENGYFARLGGDNFLAIVRTDTLPKYLDFIQNVTIRVSVRGIETPVHIEFNVGVSEMNKTSTMSDIMTNSSIALNAAKRSPFVDIMYFRPEMLERTIHDKGILSAFGESLAKKQFLVFYQPKVDLSTNTLCGCEALTRWQREKLIPPSEFIPVLENEGSIRSLDFYMLDTVCRDLRDWIDRGIEPVCTSVNFSKIHLSNLKLEDEILKIVDHYEIPPHLLEIELTELSDYQFYDRLISFVNKMHEHNIRISIDDFGTGYSSIKLIKNLQADVIKIDKSLIDNIKITVSHNPDKIVSSAIINMARDLNIEVIAEGVETSYQAEFLKSAGCQMAQGYLFDRPLPHDEFEDLLTGVRVYNTGDKHGLS